MSFFSFLALANASGPHGYQSTGLWACCRRYGLVCWARRLVWCFGLPLGGSAWREANDDDATSAAKTIRRIGLVEQTLGLMVGSSMVRGRLRRARNQVSARNLASKAPSAVRWLATSTSYRYTLGTSRSLAAGWYPPWRGGRRPGSS